MTWDNTIPMEVQVAQEFVDQAEGHSTEREFLLALYQEVMALRRREWDKERARRRRDIARGAKGFVMEEVTCKACGRIFGRLKSVVGRPRIYCCAACESRATTRRWRRG